MIEECARSCGGDLPRPPPVQAAADEVAAATSAGEVERQCRERSRQLELQLREESETAIQAAIDAAAAEAEAALASAAAEAERQCDERLQQRETQLRKDLDAARQECDSRLQHEAALTQSATVRTAAMVQQLRDCDQERMKAAQKARGLQDEFIEGCEKELVLERRGYERKVSRMEKEEWQNRETAKLAKRRADSAEEKLRHKLSGYECKASARRNMELTKEASAAEQSRLELEAQLRRQVKDSEARRKELQAALDAAEAARLSAQQELELSVAREQNIVKALAAVAGEPVAEDVNETAQAKCRRAAGRDGAAACDAMLGAEDPLATSASSFVTPRQVHLLRDALATPLANLLGRASGLEHDAEAAEEGPFAAALLFGLAYSALGLLRLFVSICEAFWGLCLACVRLPDEVNTPKSLDSRDLDEFKDM